MTAQVNLHLSRAILLSQVPRDRSIHAVVPICQVEMALSPAEKLKLWQQRKDKGFRWLSAAYEGKQIEEYNSYSSKRRSI